MTMIQWPRSSSIAQGLPSARVPASGGAACVGNSSP
jgi:hypothetical protein